MLPTSNSSKMHSICQNEFNFELQIIERIHLTFIFKKFQKVQKSANMGATIIHISIQFTLHIILKKLVNKNAKFDIKFFV